MKQIGKYVTVHVAKREIENALKRLREATKNDKETELEALVEIEQIVKEMKEKAKKARQKEQKQAPSEVEIELRIPQKDMWEIELRIPQKDMWEIELRIPQKDMCWMPPFKWQFEFHLFLVDDVSKTGGTIIARLTRRWRGTFSAPVSLM
jgi:hypothetical protein